MKKQHSLFIALALLSFSSGRAGSMALEEGFTSPPAQTKPWCYWYWVNDNISKEGVTKDLEAMSRIGIGEALIGNIFLKEMPAGKIQVLTPQWWEVVAHTMREGQRTGVNIGMFNCPGWSQSGGPWVKPEQTMRRIATSETRVSGPKRFEGKLASPAEQFQDVAVLAFPAPALDKDSAALKSPSVTSEPPAEDLGKLMDGDLSTNASFPKTAGVKGPLTINVQMKEAFTARSLQLHPCDEMFEADCELQAADATSNFKTVKQFHFDRANMRTNVEFIPRAPLAISFGAVSAKQFRLILTNVKSGPVALAEIELSGAPRLEAFVEKQLGKMHSTPLPMWGTYLWPTQAEPDPAAPPTPLDQVRNLSANLAADGTLRWDVPAGDWLILRTGMTPTGMRNSPASPEGQGLEVDKMNRDLAKFHFGKFIGEALRRIPASERKAFKQVVGDSYEMGSENWTDGFDKEFQKAYGYDPLPWLPVLTGRLVGSADASERFLWDMRRLVADKIATEYVGGLREESEKNGLGLWLENYGHWGFPSEFLKYGSQSDRIGGEFWVTGDLGSIELRAASSCANTYGKPFVSAEAFTGGPAFRDAPSALKARGDWAFCEGVNHFVLHVYIQQPWDDKVPGVNAPWGTEFNRNNTWFEQGKTWVDYVRRSCWLLQQGNRVADVAYFIGEDAPKMTGIRKPDLPAGYDFDYINSEVIEKYLGVSNGALTLPQGNAYRVLVLPELGTMRPEVLRKIQQLVKAGATVLGPPPLRSPSMQDFPKCDEEVRKLAREIWGDAPTTAHGEHSYGKGRVIWGKSLEEVLAGLNSKPDFQSPIFLRFTHRHTADSDIYFVANPKAESLTTTASFRAGGRVPELWYPDSGRIEHPAVYRDSEGTVRMPLSFGPTGSICVVFRKKSEANTPSIVSLKRDGAVILAAEDTPPNSQCIGTMFPLQLSRDSSGQVLAHAAEGGEYEMQFSDGQTKKLSVAIVAPAIQIDPPWEVSFAPGWGAPEKVTFDSLTDWTKSDETGIKFYSGKASYKKSFELPASALRNPSSALILDLGDVRDLATVRVNGREFPTLGLAPGQLDLTSALQPGTNAIEVIVTNPWNNRLVGDLAVPAAERRTSLTMPTVKEGTELIPAGLLGPVTLRTVDKIPAQPRNPTSKGQKHS